MFRKIITTGTAGICAVAAWLLLPGAQADASTPPGVGQVALSAYGCNGSTCIEIDGSGTTVLAIFGQTQNNSKVSIKTVGTVYDNGTAIHSFPAVTLSPGGTITQEWQSPSYSFRSGDQVCVHYSGISGEPCETIG